MTFQALPGFRDFAPEDLAFRNHILAAWRRVARRYGFEEYDGPPLEPLELYTAKSGEEIVGQLFDFTDKGGRHVTLRPEMTPTFARMVSARANGLRKPIRWFSVPQLFRYEKQQRGRLREHFQLNCDLVGEAGPLADAEVIALAIDVCRELGLTAADFRVRLSDRRVIQALLVGAGLDPAHHPAALGVVDKLERLDPEARDRAFAGAGLMDYIDAVVDMAVVRSWDQLEDLAERYRVDVSATELRQVHDALGEMGLYEFVEVDLSIVRGLAYYTGTVFELFDRQGKMRAICGGGRYDTLLQSLGGVDLPSVGFGMGDVVLGELLKDRGLRPAAAAGTEVMVAAVTAEDLPATLGLAHELRDAGLAAEYAMNGVALGKQLRQADARGARLAVVIGPDDRATGMVQVKDLHEKTQVAVARDAVVAHCTATLGTS
ncbi:MAG: histidine--tRNA ligase [Gemmatimonadales bacterium]|nr:histidine--tRNA ligase [Gemmatimonadales bacterium]